jgi:hypothetical protein
VSIYPDPEQANLAQKAFDLLRIGQGKRRGLRGASQKLLREMGSRGGERQGVEFVLFQRSPADEAEPSTRPKRLTKIGKGRPRLIEEHHAKAGKNRVQRVRLEREGLRVAALERDVRRLAPVASSCLDGGRKEF